MSPSGGCPVGRQIGVGDLDTFGAMRTEKISEAIAELETYAKRGESYTNADGRFGWRNPIRADTGDLLHGLALASGAKRALEIGTAHGLSALYLVSGMDEDAHLDTIEFHQEVGKQAQALMDACAVPVKVLIGEAREVISGLETPYDLVFFDAQKDQYCPQLMDLLDRKLIGKGTLLLADNVTDREEECRPFLDWFVANGVGHHIVPTECGLLVARL